MRGKVTDLVQKAAVVDSRTTSDTIRVWESYREQAGMWRAIALLQIPVALLSMVFALVTWTNRKTILNVPPKPLPGVYQAQDIPDSEFVDAATNFINLIATYQHVIARRQFQRASELIINPLLEKFKTDFMETELKTIENTSRSQVFFVDPTKTRIKREGSMVQVTMAGDRMKVVAGRELDPVQTKYVVTLRTLPRTDINPYGIVIQDLSFENIIPDYQRKKEG
ncbi:MAG: hypothetical protein EBZ48_11415 [Proteobacteria bacterium]|nr:hypothetical protein [Pseudomonadota bacterium]